MCCCIYFSDIAIVVNESGEAVPVSEWKWEDGQIKPHRAAKRYSGTPDRDFRCFYPCEIILSHIPTHTRSSGPYVSLLSKNLSHITTHVR